MQESKNYLIKRLKIIFYYKGDRKLIDAGNVRVNLEKTFDSGAKKSSDWDGYLEIVVHLWKFDHRL